MIDILLLSVKMRFLYFEKWFGKSWGDVVNA